MKIYQLAHELINKFVPMDEATKVDLQSKAANSYGEILLEAQQIKEDTKKADLFNTNNAEAISSGDLKPLVPGTMKLKHKVVAVLEQWYMRYFFAIAFIFLVPKIKSFINGEGSKDSNSDHESEEQEYQDYMDWKRFKKFG